MEPIGLTQNPFAALSFVAAPALLTNASSVLAMSTINRMLRTRERMLELYTKSENSAVADSRLVEAVNRVEQQATYLLKALHAIYLALAAFASATLVTLLGAGAAAFEGTLFLHFMAWTGIALGLLGVSGLVTGCINLFRATRLSLQNIREEANLVRKRQRALQSRS